MPSLTSSSLLNGDLVLIVRGRFRGFEQYQLSLRRCQQQSIRLFLRSHKQWRKVLLQPLLRLLVPQCSNKVDLSVNDTWLGEQITPNTSSPLPGQRFQKVGNECLLQPLVCFIVLCNACRHRAI